MEVKSDRFRGRKKKKRKKRMTIIIVVQKSDIDLAHDQSIIILTKFFRFFLFMCDSPNLSNLPP